jgi:mono/diheme cytochrome c family protein
MDDAVVLRPIAAVTLALTLSAAPGRAHAIRAHQDPEAKELRNSVPGTAESLTAGSQSYARMCALCHGSTGNGDGKLAAATAAYGVKPSNLTDNVWDHGSTDGEIFVVIRDGIGPDFNMPGFKGRLSDTEIWNVVNYVRSLGPKK